MQLVRRGWNSATLEGVYMGDSRVLYKNKDCCPKQRCEIPRGKWGEAEEKKAAGNEAEGVQLSDVRMKE